MPRKKAMAKVPNESVDAIDYSKTECVELKAIIQLERNKNYRVYYAPEWKDAVRCMVNSGRVQPDKVYKWQNLVYVEADVIYIEGDMGETK